MSPEPGQGQRPTAMVIALRNTAIMSQLHAKEKVSDVAAKHGLTTRQVRRIAKAFEMRSTSISESPVAIVERAIREYDERISNLALLAAEAAGKGQLAVAVGALKAQADAHERYLELLRDVGKLPEDLEHFRTQTEMLRLGKVVLDLVEQTAAGEMTPYELGERVAAYTGALEGSSVDGSAVEDPPELEAGEEA